jgi:hypothetical protein
VDQSRWNWIFLPTHPQFPEVSVIMQVDPINRFYPRDWLAKVVSGPEDGPQDLAFDYTVYGLRIGFEEASIVQEKEREACIPSPNHHRALYERKPDLRQYNALEPFRAMRAATGQIGPVDLSTSKALHDAIGGFDPAVHSVERARTPGEVGR